MTREELEHARDLGAATYLNAYIRLLALEIGVGELDAGDAALIAQQLVEPVELAARIGFCSVVGDGRMAHEMLGQLVALVDGIDP